jgi:hypothetical protein
VSIPLSASNGHCNDPFSSRSALYRLKVKFTVIAANVVLEAAANRPDFVVMDIKGGKKRYFDVPIEFALSFRRSCC